MECIGALYRAVCAQVVVVVGGSRLSLPCIESRASRIARVLEFDIYGSILVLAQVQPICHNAVGRIGKCVSGQGPGRCLEVDQAT